MSFWDTMILNTKGKTMNYELTSWANGFGIWHCRADFTPPGLGNSPEAEGIKHLALAACKRRIRRELVDRESPGTIVRLSFQVFDIKIDSMNRMWSITVAEKS